MKVAIVGSRNWEDKDAIRDYVQFLPKDSVIVSGGARGVDLTAEAAAKEFGLETKIFLADWDTHGKGAGMIRNSLIVSYADEVVAFWDGSSKGTKDAIDKALAAKHIRRVLIIKQEQGAW